MASAVHAVQDSHAPPIVAGLPAYPFKLIGVEPISGACGCEISGVDLRQPLAPGVPAEIMKAFEHFAVINRSSWA
jgi:taurine dioxygenase